MRLTVYGFDLKCLGKAYSVGEVNLTLAARQVKECGFSHRAIYSGLLFRALQKLDRDDVSVWGKRFCPRAKRFRIRSQMDQVAIQ